MGCDIHACVQYRPSPSYCDFWMDAAIDVNIERCYSLFAAMADVRNCGDIVPVSTPRGLPEDLKREMSFAGSTFDAAAYCKHWEPEAHSHSWLTLDEFAEALGRASFARIPAARAVLDFMRAYGAAGLSTRIVFFFDN